MLKTLLAGLACLLLMQTVVAQQVDLPVLPDTTAGHRVAAYIKAFNSGDEQLMRAFFADNVSAASLEGRPIDARLAVYREMRRNMEMIELRRINEAREDALTVLVQTKKGEWFEFGFEFEPQPQHKLVGLRVEDVGAPPQQQQSTQANLTTTTTAPALATPPASMTEAEAVRAVESFLDGLVAADEFSGTVLLAKGGKPIFQRAYGLASKEYNLPNRADTKFNLGSINKIFTQLAIGQLVEQGKLSFDDKLGQHLPDYPNRQAADKVTIRQLLDMSSGIGDFFGPEFEAMPKDRLRSIKDFMPLFAARPLRFEPGTKREYSNGGYIVLGAIVEKVSGQDYYQYVREYVFGPAGMQNTDWYEADIPTPNMANGYTLEGAEARSPKARRNNIYSRPAKGSPAGGGYSTAEDLLKFALALQTRKLRLPDFRASAAGAVKQNSPEGKPAAFPGMGFAGGAAGINALLEVGPPQGYILIVLSNYDPPSAEKAGKQIRGWLTRVKN